MFYLLSVFVALNVISCSNANNNAAGNCTTGQEQCPSGDGLQHQICNAQGVWEQRPCPSGQSCSTSSGLCFYGECNSGAERCLAVEAYGHEICDEQGQWRSEPCSSSQVCSLNTGKCTTPVCQRDEERCETGKSLSARSVCSADRLGFEAADCSPDMACMQQGLNTVCQKILCTPGQKHCSTDHRGIVSCDSTGTQWKPDTDCSDSMVCLEEGEVVECRPIICTVGSKQCQSDFQIKECVVLGTQWKSDTCSTNTLCIDDETVGNIAICQPIICEVGQKRCSADHTALEVCDRRGTHWSAANDCLPEETCANTECITATVPLGEVLIAPPLSSSLELKLTAGRYALALVNLRANNSSLIDLPIKISGDVLSSNTPLASSRSITTNLGEKRWICGTPQILQRQRMLTPLARFQDKVPFPSPPIHWEIGDARTFHVPNGNKNPIRTGVLRAIGEHVQVWEDITDSAVGMIISDTALSDIVTRLDMGVVPRVKAIFGNPSDVDDNGKIDVFYTSFMEEYYLAFINPYTLFPPGTFGAEVDSGEILYSRGPDPVFEITAEMVTAIAAHELQHIVYYGQRLAPYLNDITSIPDWVFADIYAAEGMADLSYAWSGQGIALHALKALEYSDEWSLSRFFAQSYLSDTSISSLTYGYANLIIGYLFDQFGSISISGISTVTDLGGIGFVNQFTQGKSGGERLGIKDGRSFEQAYVDLGATFLLTTLENNQLAASTIQNTRYHFQPVTTDKNFGGQLGIPVRLEDFRQGTGPVLQRIPWSQQKTMRQGGMVFLDVDLGDKGGTITVTDLATAAILVRYKQ